VPRKRRTARKKNRKSRKDPFARERTLEALQRMRSDGLSLTRATRVAGTTPATARKYVGSALKRTPSGRWAPTRSDRLTRYIRMLTKDGVEEVRVRGSNPASRVARHMAAVDRYLRSGEIEALAEFHGQSIQAGRVTYPFITDEATLERLHAAGEVSFERLYTLRG